MHHCTESPVAVTNADDIGSGLRSIRGFAKTFVADLQRLQMLIIDMAKSFLDLAAQGDLLNGKGLRQSTLCPGGHTCLRFSPEHLPPAP